MRQHACFVFFLKRGTNGLDEREFGVYLLWPAGLFATMFLAATFSFRVLGTLVFRFLQRICLIGLFQRIVFERGPLFQQCQLGIQRFFL